MAGPAGNLENDPDDDQHETDRDEDPESGDMDRWPQKAEQQEENSEDDHAISVALSRQAGPRTR